MANLYSKEVLPESREGEKPSPKSTAVYYKFDEQESTTLETVYYALFNNILTSTSIVDSLNRGIYNIGEHNYE